MSGPKRVQLRRTLGWRKPEGAIVVSRPSRWGSEFQVWQYPKEKDWCAEGYDPVERVMTFCKVATKVEARAIAAEAYRLALPVGGWDMPTVDEVREKLRGHDLCCWCPLDEPCHADVLLEIANAS